MTTTTNACGRCGEQDELIDQMCSECNAKWHAVNPTVVLERLPFNDDHLLDGIPNPLVRSEWMDRIHVKFSDEVYEAALSQRQKDAIKEHELWHLVAGNPPAANVGLTFAKNREDDDANVLMFLDTNISDEEWQKLNDEMKKLQEHPATKAWAFVDGEMKEVQTDSE
jgi:hypothetical protein